MADIDELKKKLEDGWIKGEPYVFVSYASKDNILTEREKTIIIGRFGLFGSKEMTQNELAAKLNISRSYVSRIERHALNKLYALLENKKLIG